MEDIKTRLKEFAVHEIGLDNDDWDVSDYAAGNIGDAYSMGLEIGEVMLARELLAEFWPEDSK